MQELPSKHVGAGVVQPHGLIPRGDEQVIAVVGEPEVGDPVGRRARELAPRRRRHGGRHFPAAGWGGGEEESGRFFRVLEIGGGRGKRDLKSGRGQIGRAHV